LVTILPGSRTQEVTANLPTLLRAAHHVQQRAPGAQFAVASYSAAQAELAESMVAASGVPAKVYVQRTDELIRTATCAMAVSGSVSLELLYHAKPAVVLYRISRPAFFVQQFFRQVRYITLANLVAVDDPFALPRGTYDPGNRLDEAAPLPEYLACADVSEQVARHVIQWLTDETARDHVRGKLLRAREKVVCPGASERAAEYILSHLEARAGASHERATAA
jgi:lipid-A-disaccharide synthase